MPDFAHQRHKAPRDVQRPRELVVGCVPMRSNVNLSRIVRVAACCGVKQMIACGNPKIDPKIARDGLTEVKLTVRRSLAPILKNYRELGYRIVGLEQTTNSQNIHDYRFQARTLLVIGNERLGISDDLLALLDDVIEIPVYGKPFSYNAATATTMALYEYCRQFPTG